MKHLLAAALFTAIAAPAQAPADTDHDGLPDTLEQALLERFTPTFMVSKQDCSVAPARFQSNTPTPIPQADDGTIYGQAFPTPAGIELHFYHLWRADCGRLGHPLDDEHVSALVTSTPLSAQDPASYVATHWYAAAHEDTVCDASQITRASTIDAETHGPTIWISSGKHASFLAEDLCRHGCGGDRCQHMTRLAITQIINLGEPETSMNGAQWTSSRLWPGSFAQKMSRTDMPADRLARLAALPESDIAWANPGQRPAQAVILGGNSTIDALALSNRKTDTALVIAGNHTGTALGRSYNATRNAITRSLQNTGSFLGGGKKDEPASPPSTQSEPAKLQ